MALEFCNRVQTRAEKNAELGLLSKKLFAQSVSLFSVHPLQSISPSWPMFMLIFNF